MYFVLHSVGNSPRCIVHGVFSSYEKALETQHKLEEHYKPKEGDCYHHEVRFFTIKSFELDKAFV